MLSNKHMFIIKDKHIPQISLHALLTTAGSKHPSYLDPKHQHILHASLYMQPWIKTWLKAQNAWLEATEISMLPLLLWTLYPHYFEKLLHWHQHGRTTLYKELNFSIHNTTKIQQLLHFLCVNSITLYSYHPMACHSSLHGGYLCHLQMASTWHGSGVGEWLHPYIGVHG